MRDGDFEHNGTPATRQESSSRHESRSAAPEKQQRRNFSVKKKERSGKWRFDNVKKEVDFTAAQVASSFYGRFTELRGHFNGWQRAWHSQWHSEDEESNGSYALTLWLLFNSRLSITPIAKSSIIKKRWTASEMQLSGQLTLNEDPALRLDDIYHFWTGEKKK